jgi:pentatricopeptide repeat protein
MMPVATNDVFAFVASMWVELFFVACFALGFAALRATSSKRESSPNKARNVFKNVHSEAASRSPSTMLAAWRAVQVQQATPLDTLKLVVQAFLDAEPSSLVNELVAHLTLHGSDNCGAKAATAALEVVARAGNEGVMEGLYQAVIRRLRIPATMHMQEILLSGHATAGNEAKVAALMAQLRDSRQKITVRAYSLVVKGFLKNTMLDAALVQIKEMRIQGLNVPSFAVSELFRVARDCGRTAEVFRCVEDQEVPLTGDAATSVLEDCLKSQDINLAKSVERRTKQSKVQLNFSGYEALLKLHASAGEMHCFELFEEVQRTFDYINDGFCVNLISRCAEPKFLQFAELVVNFLHSRGKMNIMAYSALMKVYSYCNMYDEACDLYEQIREAGLEPDSMMYGCLMKFSAECGRTELTRELSTKVSGLDIQHHMSLIRAAGRDKDVNKAFAIFDKLKGTGVHLDTAVYNSLLDVCSNVGDMPRAHKFADQMKVEGVIDIISYNTLLKGYSMLGDMKNATAILADMQKAGFRPNDISYNCLINVAASTGDIHAAWKTIETMERNNICIDHYTLSTMMKALKRAPSGKTCMNRVLALLDRHHIDVCCEEVLLNTTLEACMKYGENRRLESLLDGMKSKASMQIAAHTFANLIKVSGMLKRVQHCRHLWAEMTEVRNVEPNGVALGCMLDALVCNGCVMEGVALLRKWENRVPVNTVLYSTLIKGFTSSRDTQGAMEMWKELRTKKLPMNSMVYNAIIDANARMGATDQVSALLSSMKDDGVEPDEITMSIVTKGFCMSGELDKAIDVFRGAIDKAKQPNQNIVIVYNTILDGCCRHSRYELADEMLGKMEDYHIQASNFTLGIIVKMWGLRRQLGKAFSAIQYLPKQYGFTPNGPVKTCLLYACLRNDSVDKALEVFADLRESGHTTDAKIFSALVNNCVRCGKLERAVSLLEEAYGLSPGSKRLLERNEDVDPQCVEQLLKSLSRQGQLETCGGPLLSKLRNAKVPLNSRTLTMMYAS